MIPHTGDDNTVTTNEDITYVFAVADFTVSYSDIDSDPLAADTCYQSGIGGQPTC